MLKDISSLYKSSFESLGHHNKARHLLVFLNNLCFSRKECSKSFKESCVTSPWLSQALQPSFFLLHSVWGSLSAAFITFKEATRWQIYLSTGNVTWQTQKVTFQGVNHACLSQLAWVRVPAPVGTLYTRPIAPNISQFAVCQKSLQINFSLS